MSKDAHRTVAELLEDIVDWGERIPNFIGDADFEEFSHNELVHLAVWKCVEVVGEASGQLLKAGFAATAPDLRNELRQASDMRNRLAHGYSGVDITILWATARQFVPALVGRVRAIARENGQD